MGALGINWVGRDLGPFSLRSLDFFFASTAGGGMGALGINWVGRDLGPFSLPQSLGKLNLDLSLLETVALSGFFDFLGLCLSKFSLNRWFTADTPLYPLGFCTLDFFTSVFGVAVGTAAL